jgi:hypothetical protein
MKTTTEGAYLAPETEVIEIEMQGIIAASGDIDSSLSITYLTWGSEDI